MTRGHIDSLDGLRGFACLAVIALHTNMPYAGGGWLGVDIFFVLSGYLITGRLLAEHENTGRVRLGAFYARRAARLIPALLVVLTLCGILAMTNINSAKEITATGLVIAVTYLSDIWMTAGGQLGPLTHTWSLAVEEQFYLLWPLALLWLRTRRAIAVTSLALGALSFFLMLLSQFPVGKLDHAAIYFAPHARAWELLIGCALAATAHRVRQVITPTTMNASAWLGALLITVTVGTGQWMPVMSAWQVLAVVLGTVGLLLSSEARTVPTAILCWVPLRWFGERSYGAYLFHFPMFWAVERGTDLSRSMIATVGILVTLLLTEATFRVIERPIGKAVRSRLHNGGISSDGGDLSAVGFDFHEMDTTSGRLLDTPRHR